jgi:hypothetical protein
MRTQVAFTRPVLYLVALALISACSTTRPVTITDPQSLVTQIEVGDKIEVQRTDGVALTFKVTEVSPEGLRGADVFVPTGDIAGVQVITGPHPAEVGFWALVGAAAVWMVADPDDVCGDWPAEPCDDEFDDDDD